MKNIALYVFGIAIVAALGLNAASAQTVQTARTNDKCIRYIIAAGERVDVIKGLPPGTEGCLLRTELFPKPCPSGKAMAEPMTPEALRQHPLHKGEASGWHFRCLTAVEIPSPAARAEVAPAPVPSAPRRNAVPHDSGVITVIDEDDGKI